MHLLEKSSINRRPKNQYDSRNDEPDPSKSPNSFSRYEKVNRWKDLAANSLFSNMDTEP